MEVYTDNDWQADAKRWLNGDHAALKPRWSIEMKRARQPEVDAVTEATEAVGLSAQAAVFAAESAKYLGRKIDFTDLALRSRIASFLN